MGLPSQSRSTQASACRCLVALLGILVLALSLVGRTFETHLHNRTTVTSQNQKERVQHRDTTVSQWTPALDRVEPFYVVVCSEAVEPHDVPLPSVQVDDCLYNRPPPLA